jgi:hypothetical protein
VEQAIAICLLGVQARQELRASIECGGKQGQEGFGHGGFSAGVPLITGSGDRGKGRHLTRMLTLRRRIDGADSRIRSGVIQVAARLLLHLVSIQRVQQS